MMDETTMHTSKHYKWRKNQCISKCINLCLFNSMFQIDLEIENVFHKSYPSTIRKELHFLTNPIHKSIITHISKWMKQRPIYRSSVVFKEMHLWKDNGWRIDPMLRQGCINSGSWSIVRRKCICERLWNPKPIKQIWMHVVVMFGWTLDCINSSINGSNIHFLGFIVMPRRIPDYPNSAHDWNFLPPLELASSFFLFPSRSVYCLASW